MMKVESLSFYWNPNAVVLDDEETISITESQFYSWRHYMISGLEKFSMHKEDFEFCEYRLLLLFFVLCLIEMTTIFFKKMTALKIKFCVQPRYI